MKNLEMGSNSSLHMIDITFFSSPIGLGHATRDAAIANNFQNISSRFVTGSGAAKFFAKCNFDVVDVYNPPNFDVQNGSLQSPLKWLWKYYKYYKECKSISSEIISNNPSKLILSDEDFAALSVAQERKIPTILITDILETRFASGIGGLIERRMNRSMQDIIKKCDAVILPEIGSDEDNISRVGPIVRQTNLTRDELRAKFEFDKKTVLVSIGGTNAGLFLIEKILKIYNNFGEDVEFVIVSGPSLKDEFGENIRNLGFVSNLHELIFAADVIVSLAGKSTMDEAKAYGTPGIFIPIKGHFEQEDNARERGFSYEDLNSLEELISKNLNQKRNPVSTDGALKAYQIIKHVLESNA